MRTRFWLVLGVSTLLLAAVVVILSQVSPYRPGLAPARGYEMRNATAPTGLAAGYLKEVQAWLDVTPCEYEILGWGQDGALYYRADCGGQLQAWRAQPDDLASAKRVPVVPNQLVNERLLKAVVLDRVRVPAARPVTVEPWVREVNLRSSGYPSPDGRWLAFVAERVYGPQDVLLLAEAP